MADIVAICGKKQAGKNSLCNFWFGLELQRLGEFPSSGVGEDGRLYVPGKNDADEIVDCLLDLDSRDAEFLEWAHNVIWPTVKNYAFADNLKDVCMNLFGLTYQQCYGSDDDKNSLCEHLLWENMPGVKTKGKESKSGPMTARQFLQFFGTEIGRKIYGPVWVSSLINQIKKEQPALALITDCRFMNEVKAVQEAGGKVIRLTRKVSEDSHASETECDNYDGFDAVIDNKDMTMKESQDAFVEIMKKWNLFK